MYSSTTNLRNWLGLYHSVGVGPVNFQKYLAVDPVLEVIPQNLKTDWHGVDVDLSWLQQHNDAAIITLNDPNYPQQLKQIANAPPVLYVRGNYKCLQKLQLAIVGSRNPTAHGVQSARKFAAALVDHGFVVTSGMALGIDGASHQGAMTAHGETIAVLGSGLDIIYPPQHRSLAGLIIEQGCLVSEFPVGTQVAAYNFPRRNRIISGLSIGVLVIEAALKSGSLITADYALEQGREIFAVPGSINNPQIKGCHDLIRHGAKLVDSVTDVLDELQPLLQRDIRGRNAAADLNKLKKVKLSEMQQDVLNKIDHEPVCVDAIVVRSGLATSVVGAILLELELHGLITTMPGGYTRRFG